MPLTTVMLPNLPSYMKPPSPASHAAADEGQEDVALDGQARHPGGIRVGADGEQPPPVGQIAQHQLADDDDHERDRRTSAAGR